MAAEINMPLHKFLDQEPAPVFTAIAVLTTAVVWAVLIAVPGLGPKDPWLPSY